MSIESGLKFTPEQPNRSEVSQAERDLNEIIPILAHGLVRRIEQKGFSGKVRVQALAGDTWGVAKSPDNVTDVPNVIIYPRESLSGDRRLVNARLRHEIGNLNYPIDGELNALRGWCYENKVAPELLTSLVEATHEASVNYLEMQNSHSDRPEENFRALYEQEINTAQIAESIPNSAPYKQAVDIALLYSLSQTGIVPTEQVELALAHAHPQVQEIFDKQTRSVLDQSVKMAVPKKQVQLIRDYLWPKFSKLVALSGPTKEGVGTEARDEKAHELLKEIEAEKNPEAAARAQQAKELQERIKQMMEKMRQESRKSQTGKKQSPQEKRNQQKESAQKPEQKLSAAEQRERKEEESLLAQNLKEQLEQAREQMEKLGQKTPEAEKPQKKPSLEDIAKQAEQMRQQAQKAMQETKESGTQDEVTEEQLQQLKEQLEQLEEVAKQIAESGELEEELAKPEEEPIVYNIKEYGINEADLTPEQLEHLEKVRGFAQNTSKVYRTAMRLLMKGYQQHNPNFTDKMMQKMMERGYDVPDFSIYGSQAAQEFLAQQSELGIDGSSENFMVNFQLPKPLARFWYKGGSGSKSIPVKDGEIEWGHFYRMCMPVIYSGVDRAGIQGLYMNRLNQFGQHDPKKYYYLWEAVNLAEQKEEDLFKAMQEQLQEMKKQLNEMDEQSEQGKSENAEQGSEESGQQKESDQEQQASQQNESTPSAEKLKEEIDQIREQVEQMLQEAKEGGDEPKADLQEMKDKLDQMAEQLEQAEQGQESESGEQGEGHESGEGQQGSESQQGEGSESGEGENGEGQGEGSGEGGQQGSQGGQLGGQGGESGEQSSDSQGQSNEQSHEQFQQGGKSHEGGVESMFSKPNEELLKQLRQAEAMVGSKFSTQDESGNLVARDVSQNIGDRLQNQTAELAQSHTRQLDTLEELKRQQQSKMEAMYREMSGLDGEALRVYVDYMESTKDFIGDLTEFFIDKFKLDKEYLRERNQRRGARLQRGFTQNILGEKSGNVVINPRSFERKRPPEKPQFAWTLVIDNSGSCGGEIIEQEKKLAVALVEVAKTLDIPLEIVTFGGPDQFTFLKGFEQDISGDDLQKMVLLHADQGTPDVVTLDAACTSMGKFTDRFRRSYNFVYFMTDGQSGEGSIQEVIKRHKKDMVITGIGMAGAAQTIAQTWGKNAVEVPDVKKLSDAFIRKVEDQIDSTFD